MTRLPFCAVPGNRFRHQAILSMPSLATRLSLPSRPTGGSALSSSHQGASIPPAYHEQLDEPSCSPCSSTSTDSPRSASSTAQARPTMPAPMTVRCIALLPFRSRHVDLTTHGAKLLRHLTHALLLRFGAHLMGNTHGAEFRSAHGAEMSGLVAFLRQRLVMKGAGRVGVQREIELVLPPEIEARPRDRIIAITRSRVTLRQIGGMRGDLVSDHAGLDVIAIGQPQVFLGRDIAQHGRAEPADHRRADR